MPKIPEGYNARKWLEYRERVVLGIVGDLLAERDAKWCGWAEILKRFPWPNTSTLQRVLTHSWFTKTALGRYTLTNKGRAAYAAGEQHKLPEPSIANPLDETKLRPAAIEGHPPLPASSVAPYLPTAKEIREACLRIQEGWTPETKRQRRENTGPRA